MRRAGAAPAESSPVTSIAESATRGGRLADAVVSAPALGTMLALLTWPVTSPVPTVGTDPSWVAGLYMGVGRGIQFGADFVFTYGPLGFLEQPALYDSGLWIVSVLYRAIVYIALATALVWVARRTLPLPLAFLAVYALLVIGYLEASAVLLAFVVCLGTLWELPGAGNRFLLPVGGAVLSATELLGKVNFGLAILAICLLTLAVLPDRRRGLGLFAIVFLASSMALWLLAGQSLAAAPDFVTNEIQILAGYSSAMVSDISRVGWQRPAAVAAGFFLLGATAFFTRRDPPARRFGAIAIVAVFAFAMFKQCFVRQGLGNTSDFFPLMAGAALVIAARAPRPVGRLPSGAPAAIFLAPLAVLVVVASPTPSFWEALRPTDHVEDLRRDLRALASPTDRHRLREEGVRRMRATYRLDPKTLALLRGRQVAVEPWEIGVAWAYGLDWQPLPVIQDYLAYTSDLDQLNTDALAGSGRPTAILRQNSAAFPGYEATIDDRFSGWDPPAASRELLCRYRPVGVTPVWQVLYPSHERCGPSRLLRRVTAPTGRPVAVPAAPAGTVVYVRVHGIGVEGLEAVRNLLYRARERWVTVDDGARWRLVPGTATDGMVVRAAPGVDFPAPFALSPQAHSLSFELEGSNRQIELDFYAQPVAPAPGR